MGCYFIFNHGKALDYTESAWGDYSFFNREKTRKDAKEDMGCCFIFNHGKALNYTEVLGMIIRVWDLGFPWVFRFLGISSFLGLGMIGPYHQDDLFGVNTPDWAYSSLHYFSCRAELIK